ncbi:MAG: MMPL family transporter, partial [Deltaproteobacteria bacterium]|nr:MMPL family transporter [Deltaproteobacteria bacterium]
GVLLSGLTTISGFGSLLLAEHPALFSLGLTVTLGLAAALAAALWLLPRLAARQQPAGPKGDEHE